MDTADAVRLVNRGMVAFDLALGSGAVLAPDATLRALGHAPPSPDARALFRRNGPVWLTFAAAHLVAARRGAPRDWWALAWLRGTEVLTDVVWSGSPAVAARRSRAALRLAGAFNLALAAGCAAVARREGVR
ncbi:MAG TPA: hypothetical protein VLB47_14815 [Solirubrobacteraceae bacterium]|nr:hypothetical protein [Solirubrobacteraceae bacterium]